MIETELTRFQEVLAKRKTPEERVALVAALISSKVFSKEVKPVAMLLLLSQLLGDYALQQVLRIAKRDGAGELFVADEKEVGIWIAWMHKIVQKQRATNLSKAYLDLFQLTQKLGLTQDRGHLFDQLAFAAEPYRWSQEEMGAYADITYKDFYEKGLPLESVSA